jgi:DNA polymerase III subunit beta
MHFISSSSELQRILTKLGGVIPAKSTMPILENFLFNLQDGKLVVTATDMMISSSMVLSVRNGVDGKIAVPAKLLLDTVRSLPNTDAEFEIDTTLNKIKIVAGRGEYSLTGQSAKEYPEFPAFEETSSFTLDGMTLRKLIHQTTFAVSTDELRPAMMGILLQTKEGELRAVATDGHRLSRIGIRKDVALQLARDVIVPAKAMVILVKAMEEDQCSLSVSNTHIKFTYDDSVLISRLIDEAYPNYESVIPQDNTKAAIIKREELIATIRRVALYANPSMPQVRFDLAPGSLTISAQDVDFGGEANESLECKYAGDDLAIGFNARYLLDILTHLDDAEVTMKFSSATRAGIVVPSKEEGQSSIVMLIMPVRLNV